MANSTTTTLASHINAELIADMIRENLRAALVVTPWARHVSTAGARSAVYSSPKWAAASAAAVAEANDITGAALTNTDVTVTASEVGVNLPITDLAKATTGIDAERLAQRGAIALAQKVETDLLALAAGFSQSAGSTGVDLTLQNLLDAIRLLETGNAVGNKAFFLHPQQVADYRALIAGTSGSAASYFSVPGTIDAMVQQMPGFAGMFLGIPIFQSSLVPTANAGADRAGMLITTEALIMNTLWDVRVEFDRDASARVTEAVVTSCYGVAELDDLCGVAIITDA